MSGRSENLGNDGVTETPGGDVAVASCPWPSTPALWPEDESQDDEEQRDRRRRMRLFVAALHNTDKPQGTGWLNGTTSGFCCLGIACEVAIADGVELPTRLNDFVMEYGAGRERAYLPFEVQEWLGVEDSLNPTVHLTDTVWNYLQQLPEPTSSQRDVLELGARYPWHAEQYGKRGATYLNDQLRLPFPLIGDCFQYTYLRSDWDKRRRAAAHQD